MILSKELKQVLALLASSNRAMPANFNFSMGRNKSFGIDSDLISETDDYEMASEVIQKAGETFSEKDDFEIALIIGEDLMIASFLLTKLAKKPNYNELAEVIFSENSNAFSSDKDKELAKTLRESDKGIMYFKYCIEFGRERAKLAQEL